MAQFKRTYYDSEKKWDVYVTGFTCGQPIKFQLRTLKTDDCYEVTISEFFSLRFVERTGTFV